MVKMRSPLNARDTEGVSSRVQVTMITEGDAINQ